MLRCRHVRDGDVGNGDGRTRPAAQGRYRVRIYVRHVGRHDGRHDAAVCGSDGPHLRARGASGSTPRASRSPPPPGLQAAISSPGSSSLSWPRSAVVARAAPLLTPMMEGASTAVGGGDPDRRRPLPVDAAQGHLPGRNASPRSSSLARMVASAASRGRRSGLGPNTAFIASAAAGR